MKTRMPPTRIDRGHARFSPSGADRWTKCPGSIPFVESLKLPNRSGAAALLGTATHTLLEVSLKSMTNPHARIGKTIKVEKTVFKVDSAMANCVEYAMDAVRPVLERCKVFGIEDQLDIPATGQWGTMDIWGAEWDFGAWLLHVWDYKNGRNAVSAFKNPQLRLYVDGVQHEVRKLTAGHKVNLALHILQPNAESDCTTWRTTAKENAEWIADHVKPAVKSILDGTAKRIPGDHCRWCEGAARCPELAKAAAATMRMDFQELITPRKGA